MVIGDDVCGVMAAGLSDLPLDAAMFSCSFSLLSWEVVAAGVNGGECMTDGDAGGE